MHRFYIPSSLAPGSVETLSGPTAHHIRKVLRLRDGDAILTWNGDGRFREAILHITPEHLQMKVGQMLPPPPESPLRLTLLQALPEGDKMDWIIEKACEAGVDRIVPVQARRSVVRLSPERAVKRFEHWQRVAVAACSQCGRARLPDWTAIGPAMTAFEQTGTASDPAMPLQRPHLKLLLSPSATQAAVDCVLAALASSTRFELAVTLAVGPEGGWDAQEEADALRNGFIAVKLTGHVLRTETAGLYTLAQIQAWQQAIVHHNRALNADQAFSPTE